MSTKKDKIFHISNFVLLILILRFASAQLRSWLGVRRLSLISGASKNQWIIEIN